MTAFSSQSLLPPRLIQAFSSQSLRRWFRLFSHSPSQADSDFFLTVPPKLVQNREVDRRSNFSVVQGRGVVLPCNVEGDPPPSFSWFKDGSPISPVDIHYFVRQDGSLEIFSADPQDTAEYRCIASNVAGEVDKKMFLFVQGVVMVVWLLLLVSLGWILCPAENW